ncbi:hypothetical protein D9M70_367350 [compost metagenome]
MFESKTFILGADPAGQPVAQALKLTNRHGLVAGATGTGKTVTLQRLAELFSDAGVAVFAADIKGDLCGLGAAGNPQGKVAERIASMPWLNHQARAYPVSLWDVAGQTGQPLRTTLSEMGPLLLGNLLELTDSQQAALYAAFQVADREGLLLLDLKDLKALLNHLKQERLEQVVRLIRSKGVGVYFVTQSPSDLPDDVLAQLGLRIQHGLRAFTAKEQKSLRAVADGFRPNPAFDTLAVLTELGIGEALVGTLEEKGTPALVQRVAIAPPQSRIGPLSAGEREALIRQSPLAGRYDKPVDRESAYEILLARAADAQAPAEKPGKGEAKGGSDLGGMAGELLGSLASQAMKTAVRQAANQIGRQLVRGLMGSLLGGKRR